MEKNIKVPKEIKNRLTSNTFPGTYPQDMKLSPCKISCSIFYISQDMERTQ
jgi:hypothetical protein